ncbi:MAG: hypothetical protein ABIQ39_08065 [Ilumatobacteraceae bacterium]
MLSPSAATVRLFIHTFAATIWVGGQLSVAGLIPTLRRISPEATRAAGRTFAKIAWPAFAVLFATGIWNLTAVDVTNTDTSYQITILVKILVAVLSGVFAAIHALGNSRLMIAIGGSLGGLFAVAALFIGVLLRTAG